MKTAASMKRSDNTASDVIEALVSIGNPQEAIHLQRFFKTGKGEYGEGDVFLGIRVPQVRKVAKAVSDLTMSSLEELLKSAYHEARLCALFVLVIQYEKAKELQRKQEIVDFYLKHAAYVNNWDLVDSSAPKILGDWLLSHDRSILDKWARSEVLWEKRIAIIATYTLIKQGAFDDTIRLAMVLMHDKHDLIHKAVGWMLREVGKQDTKVLLHFLDQYAPKLSRTTLRYSIEKLSPEERKHYMSM